MHPYRRVSAYRIASKKVIDFGGGGGNLRSLTIIKRRKVYEKFFCNWDNIRDVHRACFCSRNA